MLRTESTNTQTHILKKTLLIVVPSIGIGGQEKVAVDTVNYLKDSFRIKLITFHPDANGKEYDKPCDVISLNAPASSGRIQRFLMQIKRSILLARIRRRERAAYVYSFGGTANITNVLSSLIAPGKAIAAIHHGLGNNTSNRIDHWVYKHVDAVIAISKAMRSRLAELYPDLKNIVTIENGYDINIIREKSKMTPIMDIPNGHPRYIAVGRHEKVKGFHRLLSAFNIVLASLPEARLLMVGSGSLEENLRKQAIELGIEHRVIFFGNQSNPFSYMRNADIFVMSSYSEGFPNSVIEALACGLIIISSDCGPREILMKEYSEEPIHGMFFGDYGILVENTTNEERFIKLLAEAMLEAWHNNEYRNKYRTLAENRAKFYTIDIYRQKLLSLIESLDER
jgi:glycosyltransferase involved in cell wall biosynthesis